MRGAFAKTITELADQDERVLLLSADLGYMALEPFMEKFPTRFFNVGVAEQNMVGLATGLAQAGFMPFVYSIVTFAVLRPYEFIRNGPILQQLPVRIIGVGGGLEYGHNGPTHHGLEDIGVLRTQPGINIIAPADYQQTLTAITATWDLPGPVYYRLGKDDKAVVPGLEGRFRLGRAELIREGGDLLIITMGSIATEAVAAAELLEEQNISTAVLVVASVNPPPIEDLTDLLGRFSLALTVEAHYTVGGLGSMVAEITTDHGIGCQIIRCGVASTPGCESGSQAYLYDLHGISAQKISQRALKQLSRKA